MKLIQEISICLGRRLELGFGSEVALIAKILQRRQEEDDEDSDIVNHISENM